VRDWGQEGWGGVGSARVEMWGGTTFLAPALGSTLTSWPSAVSTTQRLPLESKLTAAAA